MLIVVNDPTVVEREVRADTLFSDNALSSIHQAGRGLPRAVNNLARQALVAAYANRAAIVDEKAARQAITEMDAE